MTKRTDEDLWNLIQKHLESALDELWDAMIPEERRRVFSRLISEYVEATY